MRIQGVPPRVVAEARHERADRQVVAVRAGDDVTGFEASVAQDGRRAYFEADRHAHPRARVGAHAPGVPFCQFLLQRG